MRNRYGGDALGTTMHGSVNCHDIYGGIAMKLPEEITHGDYPAIARMLIAAGARLPERTGAARRYRTFCGGPACLMGSER